MRRRGMPQRRRLCHRPKATCRGRQWVPAALAMDVKTLRPMWGRSVWSAAILYNNEQDRQLLDRVIHCLEVAKSYVIDNPIEFQNALRSRKSRSKRAADLTTATRI